MELHNAKGEDVRESFAMASLSEAVTHAGSLGRNTKSGHAGADTIRVSWELHKTACAKGLLSTWGLVPIS